MQQKIKYFILNNTPESVLRFWQHLKKSLRKKELNKQKVKQQSIKQNDLLESLKKQGITKGDSVLVHCSLSKIGYVEGGPKTLIDALLETIGTEGTLLMPAFPAKGRNYDYLIENKVFDARHTPSNMGVVTEYFRNNYPVERSLHPTDSIIALGKNAHEYIKDHFGELTPHSANSPFRKLIDHHGKILMIGTTLNGACTNLHTLEDAVDFPYPIYSDQIFESEIIDMNGKHLRMKTKVHDPKWSSKRNADAIKFIFINEGVLTESYIGEARTMNIDAYKMFNTMTEYFLKYGVTMYTPYGDKNQLK